MVFLFIYIVIYILGSLHSELIEYSERKKKMKIMIEYDVFLYGKFNYENYKKMIKDYPWYK